MKGFWIVFDGIDGSGKGTLAREIKVWFTEMGVSRSKIIVTAEPTNGFFGKKVRELLKSNVDPIVNANQFLELYVYDRREHVEKEIIPALSEGKIILSDRFKYSTFVYQALQGISLKKIFDLHAGLPSPDLVFILDLPVADALKRIGRRNHVDVFEREDFLEKVRRGFLDLKSVFPFEKIFFIDASKDIGSVKAQVVRIIKSEFDLKGATAGN